MSVLSAAAAARMVPFLIRYVYFFDSCKIPAVGDARMKNMKIGRVENSSGSLFFHNFHPSQPMVCTTLLYWGSPLWQWQASPRSCAPLGVNCFANATIIYHLNSCIFEINNKNYYLRSDKKTPRERVLSLSSTILFLSPAFPHATLQFVVHRHSHHILDLLAPTHITDRFLSLFCLLPSSSFFFLGGRQTTRSAVAASSSGHAAVVVHPMASYMGLPIVNQNLHHRWYSSEASDDEGWHILVSDKCSEVRANSPSLPRSPLPLKKGVCSHEALRLQYTSDASPWIKPFSCLTFHFCQEIGEASSKSPPCSPCIYRLCVF